MSKTYFKYLFKSKKALSLFVFVAQIVIYFAILFTSTSREINGVSTMYTLSWLIGTGLCFVLPFLFLHFVLNKKAIDVYMTLPINRKEMIITTELYMISLTCIPQIIFMIGNILFYGKYISTMMIVSVLMLVYVIVLMIFNTGILLIGNTIIDSIIFVLGYALLPIFVGFAVSSFNTSMITGIDIDNSWVMINTSLIAIYFDYILCLFQSLRLDYALDFSLPLLGICMFVYLMIGLYSIKKNFINRQMERAESITDGFFGYKFLIHFIFGCLVFAITLSYARNYSFTYMFENCLVWYVALIILYIIATFIYKRKFNLKPFSIIFIVVVIIMANAFTKIAYDNEGFGLSYKYDHYPKNLMINGNGYITLDGEIKQYTIYDDDTRIGENYSLYFELETDSKNPNKDKLIKIINELRDESIQHYFHESFQDNTGIWFNVVSNYNEDIDMYWLEKYDNGYYSNAPIDLNTLKELSKLGAKIDIVKEYYNDYLNIYNTEEIEFNDFLEMMH